MCYQSMRMMKALNHANNWTQKKQFGRGRPTVVIPFEFVAKVIPLIPGRTSMSRRELYIQEFNKILAGDHSGIKLVDIPVPERRLQAPAGGSQEYDSDDDTDLYSPNSVGEAAGGAGGAAAAPAAVPAIQVAAPVRLSDMPAASVTAGKGAAGRGDAGGAGSRFDPSVKRYGSALCVFNERTVFKYIPFGHENDGYEFEVYRKLDDGGVYARCSDLLDTVCNLQQGEGSKVKLVILVIACFCLAHIDVLQLFSELCTPGMVPRHFDLNKVVYYRICNKDTELRARFISIHDVIPLMDLLPDEWIDDDTRRSVCDAVKKFLGFRKASELAGKGTSGVKSAPFSTHDHGDGYYDDSGEDSPVYGAGPGPAPKPPVIAPAPVVAPVPAPVPVAAPAPAPVVAPVPAPVPVAAPPVVGSISLAPDDDDEEALDDEAAPAPVAPVPAVDNDAAPVGPVAAPASAALDDGAAPAPAALDDGAAPAALDNGVAPAALDDGAAPVAPPAAVAQALVSQVSDGGQGVLAQVLSAAKNEMGRKRVITEETFDIAKRFAHAKLESETQANKRQRVDTTVALINKLVDIRTADGLTDEDRALAASCVHDLLRNP